MHVHYLVVRLTYTVALEMCLSLVTQGLAIVFAATVYVDSQALLL